jgi:hypothetical protein
MGYTRFAAGSPLSTATRGLHRRFLKDLAGLVDEGKRLRDQPPAATGEPAPADGRRVATVL